MRLVCLSECYDLRKIDLTDFMLGYLAFLDYLIQNDGQPNSLLLDMHFIFKEPLLFILLGFYFSLQLQISGLRMSRKRSLACQIPALALNFHRTLSKQLAFIRHWKKIWQIFKGTFISKEFSHVCGRPKFSSILALNFYPEEAKVFNISQA